MLKQVLHQVLKQNASTGQAKFNQSQIQSQGSTRESSLHHCVTYVPAVRAAVAPSPVESPDRMMRYAESLALLDFDPDVACESITSECLNAGAHPADWWILSHCRGVVPSCDWNVRRKLREQNLAVAVCMVCGARFPNRPYAILGPVRSGGAS